MNFDYTQEKLVMPEYGRNIQRMVEIAMQIRNRNERTRCARAIVNIMANMNPQMRESADFRNKLWDHLMIMSGFRLDVDSPYPLPDRKAMHTPPKPIPYEHNNIKMKHYGLLVEKFIAKAKTVENHETQKTLVRDIANYMKKTLLALNKDFATDDRLFADINRLSDGAIEVEEGTRTAKIVESKLNGAGITYQTKGQRKQFQKNKNQRKNNNYQRNNQRKNNY